MVKEPERGAVAMLLAAVAGVIFSCVLAVAYFFGAPDQQRQSHDDPRFTSDESQNRQTEDLEHRWRLRELDETRIQPNGGVI